MLRYLWTLFADGFRETSDFRDRAAAVSALAVSAVLGLAPGFSARAAAIVPFSKSAWLPALTIAGLMVLQAFRRDQRQSRELAEFRFADSARIGEYLEDLNGSEFTILAPVQQAEAARAAFSSTLERARAGDLRARKRLPQLAPQLLSVSRRTFASSQRYVSDYNLVRSGLESVGANPLPEPKGPA